MTTERVLLALVSLYAVVLTARVVGQAPPRLSAICERDFVDPAAVGSCLCGKGEFCLCTPSLAVDALVELAPARGIEDPDTIRVAFIVRGDGRGLALIGGFLLVGEAAEAGVRREVLEETGLSLDSLEQFCLFSAPDRDPRRHTAALVFVGRSSGEPRAADDARAIRTYSIRELREARPIFAFDHGSIVDAYLERFHPLPGQAQRARPMHTATAACPGSAGLG